MTERTKWRPTLSMILAGVLIIVLSLPVAALWMFRLYENQLVRETERELIAQGAVVSAILQDRLQTTGIADTPGYRAGARVTATAATDKAEPYRPVLPILELTRAPVLPKRPDAKEPENAVNADVMRMGTQLIPILRQAQRVTLAGFRILDPFGTVIAGRGEIGRSLSHLPEVQSAMSGRYNSVLRERESKYAAPLESISRSTAIRIFAAMPVVHIGHVAAIVYMSRTPNNILKELYRNRWLALKAALLVLAMAFAIGYILTRAIKGPIDELNARTVRIAHGDRLAIAPLSMHGSRELHDLSVAMQSMAAKLFDRVDYINTFAAHVSHELKSPLTSIHGAAELLRDSFADMSDEERNRFCDNILSDTGRLTVLLERLRDLALADNPDTGGVAQISDIFRELRSSFPDLNVTLSGDSAALVAISPEHAGIVAPTFSTMPNGMGQVA